MQVHYSCSKKAEVMGSGVKIEYMTWYAKLSAPASCASCSQIIQVNHAVSIYSIHSALPKCNHRSESRRSQASGRLCQFDRMVRIATSPLVNLTLNMETKNRLNDKNQRAPLQRFRELCHAFYTLAKHFVAARLRADNERQSLTSAGQMLVMGALQCPDFNETLTDITIPDDFQTWMDTHMDFMNNDWLAFGTL
jgi:hypothetical protein